MDCNARVLKDLHIVPNTKLTYHTTEQCGKQTLRKIAIDSGDSQMSICLCCFRRYATRMKPESTWYGWYDCSYPSNARVVGSQWYYDNAANVVDDASDDSMSELCEEIGAMALSPDEVPILELPVEAEEEVPEEEEAEEEEAEEAEEEEAEEVPEEEEVPEIAVPTKEEKKAALQARIKEIQALARPDKMTLKEIQAAFKEITNLKTQIHML
jgi:hypothetical protein